MTLNTLRLFFALVELHIEQNRQNRRVLRFDRLQGLNVAAPLAEVDVRSDSLRQVERLAAAMELVFDPTNDEADAIETLRAFRAEIAAGEADIIAAQVAKVGGR